MRGIQVLIMYTKKENSKRQLERQQNSNGANTFAPVQLAA